MKSFLIIFVLIVSAECGLLDDLEILKDKPKSVKEPKGTENRQGVLIKVRQSLENGTKIVIDALGNVIRIHPKDKGEDTNPKGTLESPTDTPIKDNEVVRQDEANKPKDQKVEPPKTDENQNKTLPTEAPTKDGSSKVKEDVKNATDSTTIDGKADKNCTKVDGEDCGNVKLATRTFFKGDDCPAGKNRADDGTCVDEV